MREAQSCFASVSVDQVRRYGCQVHARIYKSFSPRISRYGKFVFLIYIQILYFSLKGVHSANQQNRKRRSW